MLLESFSKKNFLVIGDIMLDTYVFGTINRISPEAPVPVVETLNVKNKLGGAANVALNLKSLGASVMLAGVLGNDDEGNQIENLLKINDIELIKVISSTNRPSTQKLRIIADGHQVMRIDNEKTDAISISNSEKLISRLKEILTNIDGVILQDYNKGVLNKLNIESIIDVCNSFHIPVYVDPKEENFFEYKNTRLVKPNLSEFRVATDQEKLTKDFAFDLIKKLGCEILLVTKGSEGISLFDKSNHSQSPTYARKIHDVSGAGDTVIATFALCDVCNVDHKTSAEIANQAAGVVCEEVGVVPISKNSIKDIIGKFNL
tara:strand:- start:254 stop:1204 length:951 start_codon:yes stop_codon:yes gene_type:complete